MVPTKKSAFLTKGPDCFVDAPPEVLLALPPPGEDGDPRLCEGGGHLVLCAVDVTGCPTNLKKARL